MDTRTGGRVKPGLPKKGLRTLPNRILRDGILRSEKIASVSPMAELFFRRLMSVVDDFGRYYAHPSLLLSDCFPIRPSWADEETLSMWIGECETSGLVGCYQVESTLYLEIIGFGQRLRPGQSSKFPESAGKIRGPREKSAFARASSPPPTTPPTTATPPNAAADFRGSQEIAKADLDFGRFMGAFLAAGVLLNAGDMAACGVSWAAVPKEQRRAAADCAERAARETEARFMGLPQNFLAKRPWTRDGPGRSLPSPRIPTKGEKGQEMAAKRFMEEKTGHA